MRPRHHRKMRVRVAGGNPWTQRLCGMCHQPKDNNQFYLSKVKSRGLVYAKRCIDCSRVDSLRRWRLANRKGAA